MSLAYLISTQNRRVDIKETSKPKQEQFQNVINIEIFGMRVSAFENLEILICLICGVLVYLQMIVIYNYLIGCACLCSKEGDKNAQELAGRYFFT